MDFSEALVHLKLGQSIRRSHWTKHWFIPEFIAFGDYGYADGLDGATLATDFILSCKDGEGYTPATISQRDILERDWEIV